MVAANSINRFFPAIASAVIGLIMQGCDLGGDGDPAIGTSPTSGENASKPSPTPRTIELSEADLRDRLHGFWVGQCVGNFMGLPFEFVYVDEPMPKLPEKYYDRESAARDGLTVGAGGYGKIPQRLDELQGAYTDDDTDIEFVTLHAVKTHGLGITHAQIAEFWKKYIHVRINGQDALWFANKKARELMDKGMLPPATGQVANNEFWWTIDPQLVNEIWSVFYPGMVDKAVDKADWGAQITSDSWGKDPTLFYAALLSASFVTTDVRELYSLAMNYVPDSSPFKRGLRDVKRWYDAELKDWRETRALIYNHYRRYPNDCGDDTWNCAVSAIINGLLGAMALLYGEGDFMRTVGIAIAGGYDNDNQAATLAGLMGTMLGLKGIPRAVTHEIAGNSWEEPFNNRYVNERRTPLPRDNKITDIVQDIFDITRRAILDNGGSERIESGTKIFTVMVSGMEPGPSQAPTPAPDVTYKTYIDKNAYAGYGADDIDQVGVQGLSEQQCKDRCTEDSECDCVTLEIKSGTCWKRKNCDPNGWNSRYNTGHNVYMKQVR